MVPDCENGYFTSDNVGESDAFLQRSSVLSSGGILSKRVHGQCRPNIFFIFIVNNYLEGEI